MMFVNGNGPYKTVPMRWLVWAFAQLVFACNGSVLILQFHGQNLDFIKQS